MVNQKKLAEQWIQECCENRPLQYAIFRFFNALAAHPKVDLGQLNANSRYLFQQCVRSIQEHQDVEILGYDYPTKDGTAERDYIHVQDLADLHVQMLHYLTKNKQSMLLNVGYGFAHSVLSFIQIFEGVTKMDTRYRLSNRCFGDPISLILDVSKLEALGIWEPQYTSLHTMIRSVCECSEKRRLM